MDKLIERELLAGMAEQARLRRHRRRGRGPDRRRQDHRRWAARAVTRPDAAEGRAASTTSPSRASSASQLQQTPNAFVEEQKKEMLASRVREPRARQRHRLAGRGEGRLRPQEPPGQPRVHALRQPPAGGRGRADATTRSPPTPAKNEAKLKEIYEQKKFLYEKAPAAAPDPADPGQAAPRRRREGRQGGAREGRRAGGKAEARREGIGQEGLTFAELAKQSSDDAATKARGGDLGWRARGGTNLQGEAEDKLFAAKNGAIVGPLKGNDGYVITQGRGLARGTHPVREGASWSWPRRSCARNRASARAKAAAEAALAKAKENPTATLKTIFPPPSDTQEASGADAGAAPRVEETGLFALRATPEGVVVEGIGVSNALAKAAFALTTDKPLAGPFAIGDNFFVVRLKERKEPDLADFEKRKLELAREAELAKGERVLSDWTHAALRGGEGGEAHLREPRRAQVREEQQRAGQLRALRRAVTASSGVSGRWPTRKRRWPSPSRTVARCSRSKTAIWARRSSSTCRWTGRASPPCPKAEPASRTACAAGADACARRTCWSTASAWRRWREGTAAARRR